MLVVNILLQIITGDTTCTGGVSHFMRVYYYSHCYYRQVHSCKLSCNVNKTTLNYYPGNTESFHNVVIRSQRGTTNTQLCNNVDATTPKRCINVASTLDSAFNT